MTAKISRAAYPGHSVIRPAEWRSPYVFASPHSGREYPRRFLADSILSLDELRRSEDAYVDLLIPDGESLGLPVLQARFPRAFVDVNRSTREIDKTMFTQSPLAGQEILSNRVLAGFGAIPRLAAEARPIYARKLSATEGRQRLKWCYEPYHAALRALVTECRQRFGKAILIDWHSMPSSAAGYGRTLPDIVLGDRYGVSASTETIQQWEEGLLEAGFTVARNAPYAGGQVTTLYGDPAANLEAVQIEINRRLYLNEQKVRSIPEKQLALVRRLGAVVAKIVGPTATASIAAE